MERNDIEVSTKLLPDGLKLERISKEASICLATDPRTVQDYINRLIDAYNERVDNINYYYTLYVDANTRLLEKENDILNLMGDDDAASKQE